MKRSRLLWALLAVCLLLTFPAVAHAVSVVPGSEYAYQGHTYYLLTQSSWTEAEAFANTVGGHLVVIGDAAENDWVYWTYSLRASGLGLWIGLFQAPDGVEPAGGWQWVDGTPLVYTNWNAPGEPSNTGGDEDFGQMYVKGQGPPTFWNDLRNDGWGVVQGVMEVASCGWPLYDWQGFLPPVAGATRPFRRGSTIPIKFRIARDGQPVTDAIATLSIYYEEPNAPLGEPEVVSTAAGDRGDQFRYDAAEDLYIFNLSTKDSSYLGYYLYRAEVALDDGSVHSTGFSLK